MVAAASSLFALKLWELLSVPPSFWHKIIQNHHPKHSKTASPIYGCQNNRQSFYKHPIKLKTGTPESPFDSGSKSPKAPGQKEIWVLLNALIKLKLFQQSPVSDPELSCNQPEQRVLLRAPAMQPCGAKVIGFLSHLATANSTSHHMALLQESDRKAVFGKTQGCRGTKQMGESQQPEDLITKSIQKPI